MSVDLDKLNEAIENEYQEEENSVFIKPKKKRRKTALREILDTVFICLLIAVIFRAIFYPISISGESMMPNYYDQEHGLMFKSNMLTTINRNDIVVIDTNVSSGQKRIIKRVIGLPNETIEIRNSVVYINGEVLDQPYIDKDYQKQNINLAPLQIPANEYFVMGDNRDNSEDSRIIGTVSRDEILSKGGIIFWPLDKIKIIN